MTVEPVPPDSQPQATAHSWTQAWLVALTQPNEASYTRLADDPTATLGKAYAWVFVAGLISTASSFLLRLTYLQSFLSGSEQPQNGMLGFGVILVLALLCGVPISAGLTGLLLLVYTAIQQLLAGALGGQGSVSKLFYVEAAYSAPISVAAALLAWIPILGACLGGVVGLYTLYLNALAIKAANRFGWGSAVVSMIVPLVFVVLLFVIIFFWLLYPALSHVLNQLPG